MFVNSLKGIKCNSQGIYDIFTTSFYDEFNLNDFETDYKWDYESDPYITPTIVGEWRYIDRLSKKIVNKSSYVLSIGGGGTSTTHEMVSTKCLIFTVLNPSISDLESSLVPKNSQNFLVRGIAEKLPFIDNSFDVIEIPATIDHVYSPNTVLEESHRVLSAGGSIIVTCGNSMSYYRRIFKRLKINYGNSHDHAHSWHANPIKLEELLTGSGFSEIEITTTAYLKLPKVLERRITNHKIQRVFLYISNSLLPKIIGKYGGGMIFAHAKKL